MSRYQSKTRFNAAAFKAYLKSVGGLDDDAVTHVTTKEGIKGFNEMVFITETSQWTTIAKNAATAGENISVMSQYKLHRVALCAKYYDTIGYYCTKENMVWKLVDMVAEIPFSR